MTLQVLIANVPPINFSSLLEDMLQFEELRILEPTITFDLDMPIDLKKSKHHYKSAYDIVWYCFIACLG